MTKVYSELATTAQERDSEAALESLLQMLARCSLTSQRLRCHYDEVTTRTQTELVQLCNTLHAHTCADLISTLERQAQT